MLIAFSETPEFSLGRSTQLYFNASRRPNEDGRVVTEMKRTRKKKKNSKIKGSHVLVDLKSHRASITPELKSEKVCVCGTQSIR